MSKNRHSRLGPTLLVGGGLLGLPGITADAGAQTAQTRLVDIGPCVGIRSAGARLACYDALAGRADVADAGEPDGVVSGEESASADDRPASVGRPTARQDEPGRRVERERRRRSEAEELTSEVTALREIQPGRLEITLANGQVWRQTRSDRYRLRVGHEVRIYPSRFGQSFRLTAPELRNFVQVERVR